MIAVFFAGYACFHFIHQHLWAKKEAVAIALATPTNTPPHMQKITKKVDTIKMTAAKKEISDSVSNEPKYDFYKLLPAMTVSIPVQNDPEKIAQP
jgi:hypothetical protein